MTTMLTVSKVLKAAGMKRSETRPPFRTEGFYLEDGKYRGQVGTVLVRFSTDERDRTLTMAGAVHAEREMAQFAELALEEAGLAFRPSFSGIVVG